MNTLKQILENLLRNNPSYQERSRELEVYAAWDKAVGERVAKHCWPVKLFPDDILLVGSESNAWLHQLKYLEPQILENLEKVLKEKRVRGLRFKLTTPA